MKEVPFSTILAALANPDQAFPSRYLARFSDLEPADLVQHFFQNRRQRANVMKRRTAENEKDTNRFRIAALLVIGL